MKPIHNKIFHIESPDIKDRPNIRKTICLTAVIFIAYMNISVFFGFVKHLQTLPVAPGDYGILISALALISLVLRPLISPFFHSGNARLWLFMGTGLAVLALAAYSLANGFWSILMVRLLHGIAFTVLGAALMTVIVDLIPASRSAQFFGYISVVTLLPNTMIPPLLPMLHSWLGGFNRILLMFAGLTLLVFPLIAAAGGRSNSSSGTKGSMRLSSHDILDNLKNPRILLLLAAMLMLYCGHALIFFFLDAYGRSIGIAYTGLFMTLAMAGEIGVRLVAGGAFDRMNKIRLMFWTLLGLGVAYAVLAFTPGKWLFLSLGLCFGLGWGITMPVFTGRLFDISAPRFRAFNINLGTQMFQAGFFLGPLLGAPVLRHWGYGVLYLGCAAMSGLAAVFISINSDAQ